MRHLHISTIIGSTVDQETQIALIKKTGFDGFFTSFDGTEPIDSWAKAARKNHLTFETVHGPFADANRMWEDGEQGDQYLAFLEGTIDVCSRIEVDKYILHVTVGNTAPPVSPQGLERFRQLCDHAKSQGVSVCFENLEPLPHLEAVMDFITDPYHGFCWDIGHNACYSPHINMLDKYGPRLKCLHIHDNRGVTRPGDIDYRDDLHLLPFDGILDWQWFAGRLRAWKYDGPITLEVSCLGSAGYQIMTAEEYLAEAYKRAQMLRDLIDCGSPQPC